MRFPSFLAPSILAAVVALTPAGPATAQPLTAAEQ